MPSDNSRAVSTLLSAIISRLLSGSGKGRKDDEREELDFQFDEEVVTPKAKRWDGQLDFNKWNWDFSSEFPSFHSSCRGNISAPSTARHRFSEPGDEESDGGEMSDGEINKLVIITPQVKLGGQRMFGFHNISSLTILPPPAAQEARRLRPDLEQREQGEDVPGHGQVSTVPSCRSISSTRLLSPAVTDPPRHSAINDGLYNYEDELWEPSDDEAWIESEAPDTPSKHVSVITRYRHSQQTRVRHYQVY